MIESVLPNQESILIGNFISDVENQNQNTARAYKISLKKFENFVSTDYRMGVDELIPLSRESKIDPYHVLARFSGWLAQSDNNKSSKMSTNTVRLRTKVVKHFLEVNDIDISNTKFRLKVRLPKRIKHQKEPLSKDDVRQIILACDDIRLKTYVMFLCSTGWRAFEPLSLTLSQVDWDSSPVKVFLLGEYTKTKMDRCTFLTQEIEKQLLEWIEYKYRKRGLSFLDRSVGKTIHKQIEPNRRHTDRIFDIYHDDDNKSASSPHSSYYRLSNQFSKVMDRIKSPKSGMEHLGKRHKITFQSFRRFVYGTIDSLGQNQFAEYYIGHET